MARLELNPYGITGSTLRGLSQAEQAVLGLHERLEGVWPLLVRICTAHARRLKKQGISIVVEDLVQELALALVENDGKWQPERGRYTTFVGCIWRNVRQRQDELRGVVPAPHNAYSMLKKLRRERADHELSPTKFQTLYGLEAVHRAELPYEDQEVL